MTIVTLSEQARAILERIAEGYTISDVLLSHPQWALEDIASAAREALRLDDLARKAAVPRSGKTNLRTYEVWTEKEDTRLQVLLAEGATIQEMSLQLERHPANIRRRIETLGLV